MGELHTQRVCKTRLSFVFKRLWKLLNEGRSQQP